MTWMRGGSAWPVRTGTPGAMPGGFRVRVARVIGPEDSASRRLGRRAEGTESVSALGRDGQIHDRARGRLRPSRRPLLHHGALRQVRPELARDLPELEAGLEQRVDRFL